VSSIGQCNTSCSLLAGVSKSALHEFETALEQTPKRYRTFLGIARVANAAGDRQKASEYYGKLVELAKNADTERQETREAKEFLAQK
jgi:Tfp pilus assembly protein PilF